MTTSIDYPFVEAETVHDCGCGCGGDCGGMKGIKDFKLTPGARTALFSAGVGITSWAISTKFAPEYRIPIMIAGGAVGTVVGELYTSFEKSEEVQPMNGWLKDIVKKAADTVHDARTLVTQQFFTPFDLVVKGESRFDSDVYNSDIAKTVADVNQLVNAGLIDQIGDFIGYDLIKTKTPSQPSAPTQPNANPSQPDSIEDVPTTNTASMGTLVLGALAIGTVLTLALKKEEINVSGRK